MCSDWLFLISIVSLASSWQIVYSNMKEKNFFFLTRIVPLGFIEQKNTIKITFSWWSQSSVFFLFFWWVKRKNIVIIMFTCNDYQYNYFRLLLFAGITQPLSFFFSILLFYSFFSPSLLCWHTVPDPNNCLRYQDMILISAYNKKCCSVNGSSLLSVFDRFIKNCMKFYMI